MYREDSTFPISEQDDEEKQRQEIVIAEQDDLLEWRQLREEQDQAYAECLLSDQRKRAEEIRREEVAIHN